jgi:hypothetical protein
LISSVLHGVPFNQNATEIAGGILKNKIKKLGNDLDEVNKPSRLQLVI